MTLTGVRAATSPGAVLDGPALWSAQAHMPSVLGRQLVVERGEGSYVLTTDGRRLFDGTAGLWHANVGHAHPALAKAAHEQMTRLETYHVFARFTNDKALELAERLAALAPIDRAKVLLNSGGSDAIDVACKLARRHWQLEGRGTKKVILSRQHAYHGLHAYGTSIAGLDFNREGYGTESLVPETARVSYDDIAQVEAAIERLGADSIAAPRAHSSWITAGDALSEGSTCFSLRMRGSPSTPPRSASVSRSTRRSNQRLFVWKYGWCSVSVK